MRTYPFHFGSKAFFTQMHEAERLATRMREIAIECGGTFGEGACYDELSMTEEQHREYCRRWRAEMDDEAYVREHMIAENDPGSPVYVRGATVAHRAAMARRVYDEDRR